MYISLAVIEKEMCRFYGVDLIDVCSKHWTNIHGHFSDDDKDDKDGKGTPHVKKMFSFGHCPNEEGGRALPELKNTLYIFLYDGRKRCTSCPKGEEGGGR